MNLDKNPFTIRAFLTGIILCLVIGIGEPFGTLRLEEINLTCSFSTPAAVFLLFVLTFCLSDSESHAPPNPAGLVWYSYAMSRYRGWDKFSRITTSSIRVLIADSYSWCVLGGGNIWSRMGRWHVPEGANFLCCDGHVEFLTYPNKGGLSPW